MTTKNQALDKKAGLFLKAFWAALITLLIVGCGNPAAPKVYRVGLLSGAGVFNSTLEGFKETMTELGYIEGENITYDLQEANGDGATMQAISEKFVADGVDLIVTTTNAGAIAAQKATADSKTPVIFTIVLAPTQTGIVSDLREPGDNVTGVRNPLEDFIGKRIEFLHQMDPDIKRIWVPYNPQYVTVNVVLERLRKTAPLLNVELVETTVDSPEAIRAELEKLTQKDDIGIDAILVMPDLTVQTPAGWEAIVTFANEHEVPIAANTETQVDQGALFAYLSDNIETGQLAAPLADKVLRGSDPASIPVASAEPRLIINYQISQALGLTINESMLAQAIKIVR